MKTRLLGELVKKKIGLRDTEELVKKESETIRGNNGKNNQKNSRICSYKEERKLVENLMRRKIRGNTRICIDLRKEKIITEKALMAEMGGRTRAFKRIVRETKQHNEELRKQLDQKNKKKGDWLVKKYGKKDVSGRNGGI